MKFMHKWLYAVAVVTVSLFSVSHANAETKGILQQVIDRGAVRIAIIGGAAPWSSISPSGDPQGYEIEIAKSFASALGVKPVFVTTSIPGRSAMLQSGKADMVIAQYTNTAERAKTITFTRPYMTIGMQFLVLADRKDINSVQDLDKMHAKIAATRGGYTQTLVPHLLPNASILNFDNIKDEILAVDAGQADATSENQIWNRDLMTKNPGKYKVIPGLHSHEELSIAVPKGDFDWWQLVNDWVEQFNASGDNNRMFKQAFGYDKPE